MGSWFRVSVESIRIVGAFGVAILSFWGAIQVENFVRKRSDGSRDGAHDGTRSVRG